MLITEFLDAQIDFCRSNNIDIEKIVMGSKPHEKFIEEILGDSQVEIDGIKTYRGVVVRKVEQLTTLTINYKLN